MPAVSVVIPVFNAERYIADALESIRRQTLSDVEVIVVDDGSTDNTVREAERFSGSLGLTVMRQKNAGPAAARNAGIRRAQGRHCAFLDADDVMLPERLAAQVELFEADPDLGLVHTDLMTFDERGIIHRSRRAFSDPCGGMVLDRLLMDNFITTSTVMAPRERLIGAGLFGEERRVSEDFELWLRMAARWKVGYLDRPLVRYRRRPGSLSDDKLLTGRCALEVIEAFWRQNPDCGQTLRSVRHRSLARHLATAGSAALAQGKRVEGLGFLLRALRHEPGSPSAWKSLVKGLIVPSRRLMAGARVGSRESS
jgi:glycosyltransferase involved in cell wall biosynthesis